MLLICVLVDCVWGEYAIGECSKTCGDGVQTLSREILAAAEFGGKECEGPSTKEETCFIAECPPRNNIILIFMFLT